MVSDVDITGTVRMIRDTRSMTQQQLADAAGVSLSTVRRLERDPSARFHLETERRIEFSLKLKTGALAHLRSGGDADAAFEGELVLWFPRSDHYRDAPLSDIVIERSYVATVMASSLEAIGARAGEELSLAAEGRLVPGASSDHHDFLFDWLPWPAQLAATVPWLHRAHDTAVQVRSVLKDGLVPQPLRMADAVMLHIAFDRAWVISTNAFFPDGEEVDEPINNAWDLIYEHCDPRPLFGGGPESEWVAADSLFHPHRWWLPGSGG